MIKYLILFLFLFYIVLLRLYKIIENSYVLDLKRVNLEQANDGRRFTAVETNVGDCRHKYRWFLFFVLNAYSQFQLN